MTSCFNAQKLWANKPNGMKKGKIDDRDTNKLEDKDKRKKKIKQNFPSTGHGENLKKKKKKWVSFSSLIRDFSSPKNRI